MYFQRTCNKLCFQIPRGRPFFKEVQNWQNFQDVHLYKLQLCLQHHQGNGKKKMKQVWSWYVGSSHVEGQINSQNYICLIERSSLILYRSCKVRVFCIHHKFHLSHFLRTYLLIFHLLLQINSCAISAIYINQFNTHLKQPAWYNFFLGKHAWKFLFVLNL